MMNMLYIKYFYFLLLSSIFLNKINCNVNESKNLSTTNELEIEKNECFCLSNYEIKLSSDTMWTGNLVQCSNIKNFNQKNLLNRLISLPKCFQTEHQFVELILTKNDLPILNSSLFINFNFTIIADLSYNRIEQIEPSSFINLNSLKQLDLSGNNLKQLNSTLFIGLKSLVKLNLTGNRILNIDEFAFRPLNNLINLDLSYNNLFAIKRDALTGLNSLIYLNLTSNYIQALEEGVFDSFVNKIRKIRLQNNQLVCDCYLSWLIKSKERFNKNLIGKIMCALAPNQPRIKLSSVLLEQLSCKKKTNLSFFELNVNNSTSVKEDHSFEFSCEAIDGKPITSIRFYKNDYLIAESVNYVNYLSDQFINSTQNFLSDYNLERYFISFEKSFFETNGILMNRIKQKLIINKLKLNEAGTYQCLIQTPFGNSSKKISLKVLPKNETFIENFFNYFESAEVPKLILIVNLSLILLAVFIYLSNYKNIEMDNHMKNLLIHMWLQLSLLFYLFHYSSTKNFSDKNLSCELYGLFIYFVLNSILVTMIFNSYYVYKQLKKNSKTFYKKSLSFLNKNDDNFRNNQFNNQQNQLAKGLISEYNSPRYQSKIKKTEGCSYSVGSFLNNYTVRYFFLSASLTLCITIVFGLFNLSQFKTSSRCFANVLLVSNFYVFVPLLILIIVQCCFLLIVFRTIKRFLLIHKKLKQRETDFVSLKDHVLEPHSIHVNDCLPCFRVSSKLDMCWNTSKHCLAQLISFLLFILLLNFIILIIISQDTSFFNAKSSSNYWWSHLKVFNKNDSSSSELTKPNLTSLIGDKNQVLENYKNFTNYGEKLKLSNHLEKNFDQILVGSQTILQSNYINFFSKEKVFKVIYFLVTFLISLHNLLHYCFFRKDIRKALKAFFIRTFCLYSCNLFLKKKCYNQSAKPNSEQAIEHYTDAVSGILKSNLKSHSNFLEQQQLLSFEKNNSNYKQKICTEQFILNDQDSMYGQTDNKNLNNQLEIIEDGFDSIQNVNLNNVLYKLVDGNENKNFYHASNYYQDGATVRLLNDQLFSSESNSTTVTTGGSYIGEPSLNNHKLEAKNYFNHHSTDNQYSKTLFQNSKMQNNKEDIYYEPINNHPFAKNLVKSLNFNKTSNTGQFNDSNFSKALNSNPSQKYFKKSYETSFDDTFLENSNYTENNSFEKAKSDIVVLNKARKLKKNIKNNVDQKNFNPTKYQKLIPTFNSKTTFIGGPSSPNGFSNQIKTQANHISYNIEQNNTTKNFKNLNGFHKSTISSNINLNRQTANRSILTTKFEREFANNQLKKYGSDNLENLDYLPPVAKKSNCKSEIMTTMSQPVNFSNNLSKKNFKPCPGRRALFKGYNEVSNNYENYNYTLENFNQVEKVNKNFNEMSSFCRKSKPNLKNNSSNFYIENYNKKPLLVCGPDVNFDKNFDFDENELKKQKKIKGYTMNENLYEKIPCQKTYNNFKNENQKTIIEHENEEDDVYYDNLDNCLINLKNHNIIDNNFYNINDQSNFLVNTLKPKEIQNEEDYTTPVNNLSLNSQNSSNSFNSIRIKNLRNFTQENPKKIVKNNQNNESYINHSLKNKNFNSYQEKSKNINQNINSSF